MTFISRILGFARDLIAAQFFGVNASVDAFYIAFKIPNFMRSLFAEGAFSQAFVPVLSEYQQKHPILELRCFIARMAGLLAIVLFFITCFGIFFADHFIQLFSPGLDEYRFNLATAMLRITFSYLMLISLTAFAGSILNSCGQFAIPALTPALLNLSLIVTAYYISPWCTPPITSQAWGILLAGLLQLSLQVIVLSRTPYFVIPKFSLRDNGVRRVIRLILPAILGASVGQINILLNTIFASFLLTGSITWLYYSERLAYFPLGVFCVALSTVLLPHLSRQYALSEKKYFSDALDWGLQWNFIIGLPASIAMIILSGPLVISLFQYGKFSLYDVRMTQQSVIAYAIGLTAFMLVKILSSAFYAQQNIKLPVKISVITLILNIIFSMILVRPLGHSGLALASSLASWFNVAILWLILYQQKIIHAQQNHIRFYFKLIISNIILAVYLWTVSGNLNQWVQWQWNQRFMHLATIALGAGILYIGCLSLICKRNPVNNYDKRILVE